MKLLFSLILAVSLAACSSGTDWDNIYYHYTKPPPDKTDAK